MYTFLDRKEGGRKQWCMDKIKPQNTLPCPSPFLLIEREFGFSWWVGMQALRGHAALVAGRSPGQGPSPARARRHMLMADGGTGDGCGAGDSDLCRCTPHIPISSHPRVLVSVCVYLCSANDCSLSSLGLLHPFSAFCSFHTLP